MSISYNMLRVAIHADRLRANYRLFKKDHDRVIPVIKSDAYGHGVVEVSRMLEQEGVDTFAVGFVREAVTLRTSGCDKRILALLGPVSDEDIHALWDHDILAAISHFDQLKRVAAIANTRGPLPICLKFDTGMRRLGFLPDEVNEVVAVLKKSRLVPVMATSHLASADEPGREDRVGMQTAGFRAAVDGLTSAGFAVEANLANSAGGMVHEQSRYDSIRLGISLYGGNPFQGTSWESRGDGYRPAMDVSAPVLQVHSLRAGESISYGWTFTAQRDSVVAIVGVGYADNYNRALSNVGQMTIHGRRVPIRGRICMQMTAVDVTDLIGEGKGVAPGDRAFLLGGPGTEPIMPEELADWCHTISYEIFCQLGMNRREYI
ncbi:alanine racemase [Pseudodesulfovibrio sp. JC047]|uniref:alanine racemase n=1 Tax=Pseudodesulfovibrio sp. JC047 TaxID=2683199 RepID=UPI0013D508DC|nr:alanine racemase [Pseudodesulfovibrio sp. JC047]NDV20420.1 alanine racemase [Pseudodesulfovibrio sp. JC047]